VVVGFDSFLFILRVLRDWNSAMSKLDQTIVLNGAASDCIRKLRTNRYSCASEVIM